MTYNQNKNTLSQEKTLLIPRSSCTTSPWQSKWFNIFYPLMTESVMNPSKPKKKAVAKLHKIAELFEQKEAMKKEEIDSELSIFDL